MASPLDLDQEPTPFLAELLSDPDPRMRADAACALGDRLRCREIIRLESEFHELLAGRIRDPLFFVRFEVAIALAELHDPRAAPVLLNAMKTRAHRLDALRALGTLGDRETVGPIRAFFRRWWLPWADRLQAAAALCALDQTDGADYLVHRLQSRRYDERAAAIHFVGESRHPQALEILTPIAQNPRNKFRDAAVRALGFSDRSSTLDVLRAIDWQPDLELRADVETAVARVQKNLSRPTRQ